MGESETVGEEGAGLCLGMMDDGDDDDDDDDETCFLH